MKWRVADVLVCRFESSVTDVCAATAALRAENACAARTGRHPDLRVAFSNGSVP
jgi:hypothetical protein